MPALRDALSAGMAGNGNIEALLAQLRAQLGTGGGVAAPSAPPFNPGPSPGPRPPGPSGGPRPPGPPNTTPTAPIPPITKPEGKPGGKPGAPTKPGTPTPDEQSQGGPRPAGPSPGPRPAGPSPGPRPAGPGTSAPTKPPVSRSDPGFGGSDSSFRALAQPATTAARSASQPSGGSGITVAVGTPPPGGGSAPAPPPAPQQGGQAFESPGFGPIGEPIQMPGGGVLTIPPGGLTQAEYNVLSGVRAGNPIGGPYAQQALDGLIQRGIVTPGVGQMYGSSTASPPVSFSSPAPQPPPQPPPVSMASPHPQPGTNQSPPPAPTPYTSIPAPPPTPVTVTPRGNGGDPSAAITLAMPDWMKNMPGMTAESAANWAQQNPNLPGAAEILAALEALSGQQRDPLSLLARTAAA